MVKKILFALCNHLNLETNRELAEYLGLKVSQIYSWRKHGKITDTGKILAKLPYLNLEWLETGKGPMAIIDENNIDQLPWSSKDGPPPDYDNFVKPKITAKIEPGNDRQRQRLSNRRKPESYRDKDQENPKDEMEDWSMSEMLVMTTAVLESKTVYRAALAANVRAFYEAVKMEDDMQLIAKKLERIENDNKAMTDHMARMEEMLLSLGAAVPQKRDQSAG